MTDVTDNALIFKLLQFKAELTASGGSSVAPKKPHENYVNHSNEGQEICEGCLDKET